ncbi:MAG: hypothetical protein GF383_11445 [Candidatus Lokiarchaeota archaeon]|nr:hypothetical protein [Candidatus Lokiarchaeota archaeon]MBD3341338.1 hypothetical protein [Candidatus Lokiarchaeota archaeon]
MKNNKIILISSILISLFFVSCSLGTLSVLNNNIPINIEKESKTTMEISQPSIAATDEPVKILIYAEYADETRELPNTITAIEDYYSNGGNGPDFYHENLTDYSELGSKLSNFDILLIAEQEGASIIDMKNVGNHWKNTLTNFVNKGGIVISLDGYEKTHHILNETGLISFTEFTHRTAVTLTLENENNPLARGIEDSWSSAVSTGSFDTTETISVVEYGSESVVVHKIVGRGEVVMLGYDVYNSDTNHNYDKILANAIRLHEHVIFDNSHGNVYTIGAEISDYADDLVSEGFAVSQMDIFDTDTLIAAETLVIQGFLGGTSYSSSELNAIEMFVNNGGGLFLIADIEAYGNKLDPIFSRFGFERNKTGCLLDSVEYVGGQNHYIYYDDEDINILNHSINLGVADIELYGSTGFTKIPSGADILVKSDNDPSSTWNKDGGVALNVPIVVASVTGSGGRVVVCADLAFINDEANLDGDSTHNYYDRDNEVFLVNIIDWVLDASPSPDRGVSGDDDDDDSDSESSSSIVGFEISILIISIVVISVLIIRKRRLFIQ